MFTNHIYNVNKSACIDAKRFAHSVEHFAVITSDIVLDAWRLES